MAQLRNVQLPISFGSVVFGTGSWTVGFSSGSYSAVHSTAANTSTIDIPIIIPRSQEALGLQINSIDIPYFCGTADLAATPTATLYRHDLISVAGGGTNTVVDTIATTNNAVVTHQTTDQKFTVAVTSPTFDSTVSAVGYNAVVYNLHLTVQTAATTVFNLYAPVVYYTEEI